MRIGLGWSSFFGGDGGLVKIDKEKLLEYFYYVLVFIFFCKFIWSLV